LNIKQKAVRGVAWTALQQSGTQFVSLVVFAILSRFLTPDDFGLVAIATVFVAFIQIFLDQGLSVALVQREEIDESHLNTAFWCNVLFGVVITTLGIMAAGWIATIFTQPELKPVVQILFLSLITYSLTSTHAAILNRKLAFDQLSTRTLIAEVVGGLAGIIMATQGFGVWSLVGRNLVRDFTRMLLLWWGSSWKPGLRFSRKRLKELFPFGINIMGDRLFYFINGHIDQLLIGYFLGSTVLGYYVIGTRVIQLGVRIFLDTISAVSLPVFSRLQNEKDRFRNAFLEVSKFSSLILVPIFGGIVLIAPEIVMVLFNDQWSPSVPIIQVLSLSYIIQSITFLAPTLLLAMGKPTLRVGLRILKSAGMFIAILISVQYGVIAIAVSFVLLEVLLSPIMIATVWKTLGLGIHIFSRQYVPAIVGSLMMGFMILSIDMMFGNYLGEIVRLLLSVFMGGITYVWVVHRIDATFPRILMDYVQYFVPGSAPADPF
jgi:O-antigen/teichoic acid export membrane protein